MIGAAIGGGVVLLLALVVGAYMLGRGGDGPQPLAGNGAMAAPVAATNTADVGPSANATDDQSVASAHTAALPVAVTQPVAVADSPAAAATNLAMSNGVSSNGVSSNGVSSNGVSTNSGSADPARAHSAMQSRPRQGTETARTRALATADSAQMSRTDTPLGTADTTTPPVNTGNPPPAPLKEMSLADLIEQVEPSVVRIDTADESGRPTGLGSGFVVDSSGIIATNVHVIAGAATATAVFANGQKAQVKGYFALSENKDIALLKIDPPSGDLRALPLAGELPRKGESVITFGAPHGLDFTSSEGIISAHRDAQSLAEMTGDPLEGEWLQTTAPISPGNSGGPLVNRKGEVVAMNTLTMTIGQNLNFAISSRDIKAEVEKRGDQLTALAPDAIKKKDDRPKGIDVVGTEKGEELLAKLDEVFLLVATVSFDPTGRVEQLVLANARLELERLDIQVTRRPQENTPLMVVVMKLGAPSGTGGAQYLELSAVLLVPEKQGNGLPKVYKVWENEGTVGSVAINALFRGIVPRGMADKVKRFYRELGGAVRKAQRAMDDRNDS